MASVWLRAINGLLHSSLGMLSPRAGMEGSWAGPGHLATLLLSQASFWCHGWDSGSLFLYLSATDRGAD